MDRLISSVALTHICQISTVTAAPCTSPSNQMPSWLATVSVSHIRWQVSPCPMITRSVFVFLLQVWLYCQCVYSSERYVSAGCSRVYEQEYGYLKSPGWPNIYTNNLECSIVLQAPQNSSISLFFTSFDVENHPSCNFDYLEVSINMLKCHQINSNVKNTCENTAAEYTVFKYIWFNYGPL